MIANHWLASARHVPSPNFNQRPVDTDISLLVIHSISLPVGKFGTDCIEQLFTNCLDCNTHPDFHDLHDLEVSSHLLIDREGEITQFVAFDQRAWHAGVSSFAGRDNCNDFSIGIELEGVDDSLYTDRQYQSLIDVTQCLMQTYSCIQKGSIVGHCDIAPGRKSDPGSAFDWQRYKQALK